MERGGSGDLGLSVMHAKSEWGHVSRMDWERLPRRMLSAWVPHARPRGAPRLTYGRSVAEGDVDVFSTSTTSRYSFTVLGLQ